MSNDPPPIPQADAWVPPIPVQPVSSHSPGLRSRPGILTAIGVLSIVVASLSALFSIGGVFMTMGFAMISRMANTTIVAAPAVSPVPGPGGGNTALFLPDENAIDSGTAGVAIAVLR